MNEYMESFFLYDPWDAASPVLDPSPLDPSPFEVMEPELPESVPVPDPPSVPPFGSHQCGRAVGSSQAGDRCL